MFTRVQMVVSSCQRNGHKYAKQESHHASVVAELLSVKKMRANCTCFTVQ